MPVAVTASSDAACVRLVVHMPGLISLSSALTRPDPACEIRLCFPTQWTVS